MVAGDVTPPSGDPMTISPSIEPDSPESMMSGVAEFMTPTASPETYTGELICLKVKDVLGITPVCGVHTFVYTPFATFQDLLDDVATKFQISPGDFELVYQSKSDLYELTQMPPTETLSAANLIPTREKEYSISINSKKSRGRRSKGSRGVARKLDEAFEACVESPNNENTPESTVTMDLHISDLNAETGNSTLDSGCSRRDFVGLKNMNMTCYLNSLLQGLWFTPEFRNLIYVYMHKPENSLKKSICVPLQKLFLRLQFSIRESIETDELTNTFGWNSRDNWQQHDIEELCNLLMENLSKEFKDTPLEGMIEALFFGLFNDYVKCLVCERRNMRDAAFLVLPLPIRQIGAPLENPTLEDALKIFTTPELLDGNNQYNCSQCDKPCDAHKGFLFKKLPYILTIQLKRFEYNWTTSRRYKLNDKIVFPMVLDMNPYMDKTSEGKEISPSSALKAELIKSCKQTVAPRASHSRSLITLEPKSDAEKNENGETESSSNIHLGSSFQVVKEKLDEVYHASGPDFYQLYGVLVHRGGLTGGHYFAYIRDFETFTWYRCDDSYVRKADVEDIEVSFGGDEEDKEPTSAYMLLYRRYDPEMNALPFLFEEMPSHLQDLWNSMVEMETLAHEEEELEKNTIKMSIHYRLPGSWDIRTAEMNVPKGATTSHVAYLVYKHFFPDDAEVSIDRLRISRYDKDLGIIENSFEDKDDQYITYTLRNPMPVTKNEGLILEIREQDESFFSYSPTDFVFVAQLVDYKAEELKRIDEIHASLTDTVGKLKETIAMKLHLPKETLTLILHKPGQLQAETLEVDWTLLGDLDMQKVNHLFVESVTPQDIHGLVTFVDNYIHTILFELEVQLPALDGSDPISLSQNSCQSTDLISKAEKPSVAVTPSHKDSNSHIMDISPEKVDCPSSPLENSSSVTNGDVKPEKMDLTIDDLKSNEIMEVSPVNTERSVTNVPVMQTARKYIMQIKDERRTGQWSNCLIRADGRMPLSTFSSHLSKLMRVDEADFILYRVEKDEEVELLRLNESFNSVAPFDKIRIRLGHRLQKDEGRVLIYSLDLNYPSENCTVVGEVALNPLMTVQEAKALVLDQCRDSLDGITATKVRLRKRNQVTPSKIFRDGLKVSDYFNYVTIHGAKIYIQKLDTVEQVEEHCFPVMIRRWRPSDFTLDPPCEIVIHYDHSINLERVILDKLREFIDLPENDIEVAKPDVNYPFIMNAVAIQDLTWFPLTSNAKKSLYLYNDELALFVRDKTEQAKDISAEEENKLRLENEQSSSSHHYTTSYGISPPKKEAGLRMNLACSPP